MFSSIQSIPGLISARSNVKAKIRPGVKASFEPACCFSTTRDSSFLFRINNTYGMKKTARVRNKN